MHENSGSQLDTISLNQLLNFLMPHCNYLLAAYFFRTLPGLESERHIWHYNLTQRKPIVINITFTKSLFPEESNLV